MNLSILNVLLSCTMQQTWRIFGCFYCIQAFIPFLNICSCKRNVLDELCIFFFTICKNVCISSKVMHWWLFSFTLMVCRWYKIILFPSVVSLLCCLLRMKGDDNIQRNAGNILFIFLSPPTLVLYVWPAELISFEIGTLFPYPNYILFYMCLLLSAGKCNDSYTFFLFLINLKRKRLLIIF